MLYVVIRESQAKDTPAISEVVRNAYISNVTNTYWNALLNEITFQAIILLAAFMFIFMGIQFQYCILSAPVVLIMMYVLIYGALLMKATELMYNKRPLKCWVAETYEPLFYNVNPQNCLCKFVTEEEFLNESIIVNGFRKKIIGTVAVMQHHQLQDTAWLFRLAVDKSYQLKNVGFQLTQTLQEWCRQNQFNYVELVMSECQEGARKLFANAGFQIKQLYSKRLLAGVYTLQMFQLRSEVRSTFH